MSDNQSKVDDKLRRLVREEVEAAIRPLRKQIAELKKELAGPEAGKPEKQGKAVSGQRVRRCLRRRISPGSGKSGS